MAYFSERSLAPILRIRCAICGKPVDEILQYRDEMECSVRISVRCHGDRDSMSIHDFDAAMSTREARVQLVSQEGVAFTTKRLAPSSRDPASVSGNTPCP